MNTKKTRPSNAMPEIAIVIPVYNSRAYLAKLLDSLDTADLTGCEILVVDDCSTDESAREAEIRGYRTLRTPVNAGPAAARNLGVENSSTPVILFIDADVVLHTPDAFQMVRQVMHAHPDITTVSTVSEPRPENSGFLPSYTALTERIMFDTVIRGRKTVSPWPDFSTRFGAIRRTSFTAVNGFDTRFPIASVEDADLYYRLVDHGHTGYLLAEIRIGHHWPYRWRSTMRSWIRRAYLWSALFFRRARFDDVFSTREEALRKLFDCLVPVVLAGALIQPVLWGIVLGMETVALLWKRDLALRFHSEYGPVTAAAALLTHQLNSFCLGIGGAAALVRRMFRKS